MVCHGLSVDPCAAKLGSGTDDDGGDIGADGNGNPIGGLVFGNSFGKMQQYHEWTVCSSLSGETHLAWG